MLLRACGKAETPVTLAARPADWLRPDPGRMGQQHPFRFDANLGQFAKILCEAQIRLAKKVCNRVFRQCCSRP